MQRYLRRSHWTGWCVDPAASVGGKQGPRESNTMWCSLPPFDRELTEHTVECSWYLSYHGGVLGKVALLFRPAVRCVRIRQGGGGGKGGGPPFLGGTVVGRTLQELNRVLEQPSKGGEMRPLAFASRCDRRVCERMVKSAVMESCCACLPARLPLPPVEPVNPCLPPPRPRRYPWTLMRPCPVGALSRLLGPSPGKAGAAPPGGCKNLAAGFPAAGSGWAAESEFAPLF